MIVMYSARRLKPGAWDRLERISEFVDSVPVEGVCEVIEEVIDDSAAVWRGVSRG